MQELLRQYENTTVAVIGAGGYLGAALSETLAAHTPARLLLVSRRPLDVGRVLPDPARNAEVLTADVREKPCWDEIAGRADIVFYVAGNASVHAAVNDPAGNVTSAVLPLTHLLAAARAARRRPRVVYASTARVYGVAGTLPVAEDAGAEPVTPFGLHNLLAEQTLELATTQRVLHGIALRLGNVYGPSPARAASERNVIHKIVRLAVQGADLPLYGAGNYLRDYIHIDDVARAFLMAGVQPGMEGRPFNVASGHGITVRDAFHLIAERVDGATGVRSRVREVPWPDGETPIECRDFTADVSRMASACGWTPMVSLAKGIDGLIDHAIATHADGG